MSGKMYVFDCVLYSIASLTGFVCAVAVFAGWQAPHQIVSISAFTGASMGAAALLRSTMRKP